MQAGSVYATADGEAIVAGDKIRVFCMHVISGGSGGIVLLRNGGASGTILIKETGTANTGKTVTYGTHGVYFNNGCYIDVDVNVTSVVLSARKEVD